MTEAQIKAQIKDTFKFFDADESGDISIDEVRTACAFLGVLLSDSQY